MREREIKRAEERGSRLKQRAGRAAGAEDDPVSSVPERRDKSPRDEDNIL